MARQLHLSAKITVCRYNELTDNEKILVDKARAKEHTPPIRASVWVLR